MEEKCKKTKGMGERSSRWGGLIYEGGVLLNEERDRQTCSPKTRSRNSEHKPNTHTHKKDENRAEEKRGRNKISSHENATRHKNTARLTRLDELDSTKTKLLQSLS